MRDYGKVHTTFWTSSTIRSMSEDARHMAAYLLTCPHGTIAGVFRLPDGYVCEDMQWSPERVQVTLSELFDKGFANRCETTKWVVLTKYLEWNPPENPNQRKAVMKVIDSVPVDCGWKQAFMRVCEGFGVVDNSPKTNPSGTLPKPFLNQEQEQEQEQEQDLKDSEAKASDGKPSALTRKERNPEDTAKAELWRTAVSVLAQGGCPNEDQARTFMGKLVKDYGLDAVREAVAIAVAEQPADTREFLKATCQRIAGERKKPDVARVTVPGRVGLDPAILAAEEARKNARPPSAETLARIAQIRQGVAA